MAHRHPLQRFASPSLTLSLLLHLLGIGSFAYSFHFLTVWKTPIDDAFGWHFQFLTIIGLSASLLAFVLGALGDITSNTSLSNAKSSIAILAAPLEVVISLLYWGIYTIDPSLLYVDDIRLPPLADASLHLAPAVFLILDHLLFSPPWTIESMNVLLLSNVFAFTYWIWIEVCFTQNGWYAYPLFEVLTTYQRVTLFMSSASLMTVSSSALKWAHAKVNGAGTVAVEGDKKAQ